MITKRREFQIKKLEQELNNVEGLPKKRQKRFERSKFINLQPSTHRQQNTFNTTHKHFTSHKFRSNEYKDKSKNEEEQKIQHKSLYNRPFHLLRQYLNRKQRMSFMPILDTNPEKVEDFSQAYTTLNEFRIKKSKKTFLFNPVNELKDESPPHNKINKIDQDFISFNTSKNLYQMTQEQLQESIKWKKHFLNMLNEKIKDSKLNSIREKSFK